MTLNLRQRWRTLPAKRKSEVVAGLCLVLASVSILQIPLLNFLGYEFSVAIALLLPWVCGLPLLTVFLKDVRRMTIADPERFKEMTGESFRFAAALAALPLICATVNTLVVKNCSYAEGVVFYLLITGVTAVWTVALALCCASLFRRKVLMYVAVNILLYLYPLYIGYVSPQIYSYHPVYGYFPGFSYDEVLRITPALLLFRGMTLLASLLLILVALAVIRAKARFSGPVGGEAGFSRYVRPDRLQGGILWITIILAAAFFARERLGLETSEQSIRRLLSATLRTEHFHIFYAPESFTPEEARWVAAMHEFRLRQVEAALRMDYRGVISSFIYPSDEVKQRLIGTATTNIAKPWLREIHTDRDSWESTLRHELVHVVAGTFGMPVIRANYRTGIVEGLAMAVDDDFGNRTLHEYAASVVQFGIVRNPQELISTFGFMTHASTVSYVLAGSFCRFLLDRYGVFRFKDFYGGRSPERVYGKSLGDLSAEWQRYLHRIAVPSSWRNHVQYFFQRPSIFAKECARAIAGMNELAYRDLDDRKAGSAVRKFSAALSASWNSESFAGLVQAASEADRPDTVVQLVRGRLTDSTARTGLLSLFLLYGDALWRTGKTAAASEAYREVLSYDLSDRFDEAAALRLDAIEDSALRPLLTGYFGRFMTDSAALGFISAARRQSKAPLLDLLEAIVDLRLHKLADVIALLSNPGLSFSSPYLNAARERLLGEASFRLERFEQARVHFWESLNYINNPASVDRVNDAIDRCEWFEENGATYLRHPSSP